MEKVSERIKKSSISLVNISKSISSTNQTLATTKNSVNNISKVIANNTKVKNELFQRSFIIETRRREASKRREREDQLEASKVSTVKSKGLSFGSKTSGGVFNRLLSFLGYTTAGWLVENLPTWVFMGKEFISRIQILGSSIYNMTDDIRSVLSNFGDVLSSSLNAILSLDFNEFNEDSFKKSLDELNLSVGNLGKEIENAFEVFKKPLTESLETGEKAPGLGDMGQRSLYEDGGVSEYGTKEQQALLKAIRFAEGTSSSTGYSMFFGDRAGQAKYGDLTKLTANEVEKLVDKFLQDPQSKYRGGRSAAVGAYQIIDITQKARALGMDMNRKFDQKFQDEMALRLAAARGVTSEVLKREGLSESVIKKLSPEWASFPGNTYGQPTKKIKDIQSVYSQSLNTQQSEQTRIVQVPSGNINPEVTSRYGEMRETGKHGGSDLAVDEGTPLRAISDGTIVDSDYEKGWGNFLVMKDNLGIYHLYGHMQSGNKRGGAVKKGEVIGKVGQTGRTTGPHLHWESGTGWNGYTLSGKFDPLNKYSKYAPFNTPSEQSQPPQPAKADVSPQPAKADVSPQPATEQNLQQAQISQPPPNVNNQIESMTPERRGQDVIVADIRQAPQVPQYISSGSGGYQYSGNAGPNEFELLNNFIKNKLLLDLAYL